MDRLIIEKTHAEAIPLSVFHPEKVSGLKDTIKNHFLRNFVRSWFLLPYDKIDLLSKFYQLATVEELEYAEEGVRVNHTITPANKKILNTLLNR
jgi:50S ribosomal subunit-associated GTPase HflX